jgi:hypothetical protein
VLAGSKTAAALRGGQRGTPFDDDQPHRREHIGAVPDQLCPFGAFLVDDELEK